MFTFRCLFQFLIKIVLKHKKKETSKQTLDTLSKLINDGWINRKTVWSMDFLKEKNNNKAQWRIVTYVAWVTWAVHVVAITFFSFFFFRLKKKLFGFKYTIKQFDQLLFACERFTRSTEIDETIHGEWNKKKNIVNRTE